MDVEARNVHAVMWAVLMRVPELDSFDRSSLPRWRYVDAADGDRALLPWDAVSRGVASKAGSIGRAALHVEARIVDDNDRRVPAGTVGELAVRGKTGPPATGYCLSRPPKGPEAAGSLPASRDGRSGGLWRARLSLGRDRRRCGRLGLTG